MDRRSALRLAALTAFGMALGKYDALGQKLSGVLTVDLNHWTGLIFTHKGRSVHVPSTEIFAALEEAYGAIKEQR